MAKEATESVTITFDAERLIQLKKARDLFASDTGKSISIDDFLDVLIKTYMLYREKRGPTESALLTKLTQT
jgi:hypothetical protein